MAMRPRLEAERIQQTVSALLATNNRVMSDTNRTEWLGRLDTASQGPARGRARPPKPSRAFLSDLRAAAARSAAGRPPVKRGGER
jgi:hypothetical protein